MTRSAADITTLLHELDGTPPEQLELLFAALYDELRGLARHRLSGERPDHTLQATALVNEAYIKLAALPNLDWKNRSQFFALAARAMRQVLVSHARQAGAEKRGGEVRHVTLVSGMANEPSGDLVSWDELLTLESALKELYELSDRQGRIAELRVFGGLTHDEIAELLGVSVPTVERDWRLARAFLIRALS
jgi:RNA polymerase sigma factor (TIGR02999 family)